MIRLQPMKKLPTIGEIRRKFAPILKRSGIRRSELFGSFARGDAKASSDIDLLVQFPARTGLFELMDLRDELQAAFGRRVDLVSYRAISPRLLPYIEKDRLKIL